MFQRLKADLIGAIDSRIIEEQNRQRGAHSSPARTNSTTKRPPSRSSSPAVRSARNRQPDTKGGDPTQKGPDPKEFEPDLEVEDEEPPGRSGTPRPRQAKNEETSALSQEDSVDKTAVSDSKLQAKDNKEGDVATASSELPTDVRVKLRKLEKLESRYQELLRSYRIAHARVTSIEPFENALRENTPLTSIADPGALVEYLNQINLKGDMVLDELKRVSTERTMYKQKLDEAEKRTREAWDEVAKLRECNDRNDGTKNESTGDDKTLSSEPSVESQTKSSTINGTQTTSSAIKSPVPSTTSRTPSISALSIFSPKAKPAPPSDIPAETEEFFSYDSELPRLEAELKESQEEVSKLNKAMTSLKGELAVAQESTQSMVQTLEDATRDLNLLKEQKDRRELELKEERVNSEEIITSLRADLTAADEKVRHILTEQVSTDEKRPFESFPEYQDVQSQLRDNFEAKQQAVAKLEKLQLELDDLQAQILAKDVDQDQSVKRIKTLNGLVELLRGQLAQAVQETERLKAEVETSQAQLQSLRSQASSEELVKNGVSSEARPSVDAAGNKKKSKKKKKGSKPGVEQDIEANSDSLKSFATASHSLSPSVGEADSEHSETVAKLEEELKRLSIILEEKDAAIERLHGKQKNEEDMREEIESLRDELVNVGGEHVEVKDKMKDLLVERDNLKKATQDLEVELSSLRTSHASNTAGSEDAQKDLSAQIDDLQVKVTGLQMDLSIAQQLASTRFKDLTDLKSILQKAQPELSMLKSENAELKAAREDLSSKVTELQKIESRHNTMRNEFAELTKLMMEKDEEIKKVSQKLEQEAKERRRLEEAYERGGQELQNSENERRSLTLSLDKFSKDLTKSKKEVESLRGHVQELEDSLSHKARECEGLQEDIELKTAQHASAESLMSSMRDQTMEMAVQMKEARERCDSLEEELAEAHRLLNERSRESETMRRLLTDIEGKAESRIREMKERMDVAFEERDKAEEEASIAGRRKARELEEIRNKLRDVERSLRIAEEDKEELEVAQREWKKRREELEHRSEQATKDNEDIKRAMGELRDALDESERQARELEKQKAELRRSVEDTQQRLDRLQKSNKAMSEELRLLQAPRMRNIDSQAQSPRSSIDSTPSRSKVGSPLTSTRTGPLFPDDHTSATNLPPIDPVYLKNVLLQFLRQRDKKNQVQLIPVLGRILHFDKKDEQRWMAAITSK